MNVPPISKEIDRYLATLSSENRAALEKIRRAIRAALPDAEECIAYGIPAFRWKGKSVAGFSASQGHCSYFPMSGSVVASLREELKKYDSSKGTIRFPANSPLSAALVKKLVQARLAEIDGKSKPQPKEGKGDAVIASLRKVAKKSVRDGMARFAIPSDKAFGVPVGTMRQMAKRIGQDHELAAELWEAGWYEGRMIAVFLDEPERVTPTQMDQWCQDFDNWAICDTACFHLFDRTPHAWKKVAQWSRRKKEFEKRAAFALLWALAVHDKKADNARFSEGLVLIEREAHDERNFVKKALNMALRAIGKRNGELHAAAMAVAQRLSAASQPATARWVGKDALRELASPAVSRRLEAKRIAREK